MVLENCEGRHLLVLFDMKSYDVLSNLQASEISVVESLQNISKFKASCERKISKLQSIVI
jgi:hypothetical protein